MASIIEHMRGCARVPLSRSNTPYAALSVWALAVVAGCGLLLRYEFAPGPSPANAAGKLSGGEALALDAVRTTVVVTVHPKCPCTRASISELADVLGEYPGNVAVHIVVCGPAAADSGTLDDSSVGALPGAMILHDADGVLTATLGARTSGTVIVFNPAGAVLFWGGITPSRGHEGDCEGRRHLLAALTTGAATSSTPVFGCPLSQSGSKPCPLCNEEGP